MLSSLWRFDPNLWLGYKRANCAYTIKVWCLSLLMHVLHPTRYSQSLALLLLHGRTHYFLFLTFSCCSVKNKQTNKSYSSCCHEVATLFCSALVEHNVTIINNKIINCNYPVLSESSGQPSMSACWCVIYTCWISSWLLKQLMTFKKYQQPKPVTKTFSF